MKKNNLSSRSFSSAILITSLMLSTSCGPEIDEIVVPPIEDYSIGIPILNGGLGFSDLLTEEQMEDVTINGDTMSFSFADTLEIATTEDLVQAFGSSSTDDFFSVDFPDPIDGLGGSVPIPAEGVTLQFAKDASDCTPSVLPCIELTNDVADATVSYIRYMSGNLVVGYNSLGVNETFNLVLSNITTSTGQSSISATGVNGLAQIDLTGVEFEMSETPTVTMNVTNSSGTPVASGNLSRITFSSDNEADRVKLFFPNGMADAGFDIPIEDIDTDYLSDIFPEGAQLTFRDPIISFDFDNPLGTAVQFDLSEAQNGGVVAIVGSDEIPVSFTESAADTGNVSSCSQIIDVVPATDFEQPSNTLRYMCDAGNILSQRPTIVRFTGAATYEINNGDEIFFSNNDKVTAIFSTKIPIYMGFTGMNFTSGSDLDLDFNSEIEEINTAVLRSQVNNGIPIDGTLKFVMKESEFGIATDSIIVNGGVEGANLIQSAEVNSDGVVIGESEQYLETPLNEGQVRALLNAGYLDISFGLKADANPDTEVPEPVFISNSQSMDIKMGMLLNGTINFESDN
ncbi:hypothetical protein [Flammeovirga agarivorans]|uniref:Uncharacterized protein n=1 Tax=Flammeovirga agarivorans TaxID=2726742 RepID=A0A7X8SHG2_9BACT|nr:hypothetical protein [Flammeovirga agarivorans]NLR90295.1 hypothetical protein [Flammeovirga agarivorans]